MKLNLGKKYKWKKSVFLFILIVKYFYYYRLVFSAISIFQFFYLIARFFNLWQWKNNRDQIKDKLLVRFKFMYPFKLR